MAEAFMEVDMVVGAVAVEDMVAASVAEIGRRIIPIVI